MKPIQQTNKWGVIIVVLIVLYLLSVIFSGLLTLAFGSNLESGNVAVIPLKGVILTADGAFLEGVAISGDIVDQIERANENSEIKALVIEIDSPGGAPVASNEIATAIAKVNKTTVAWIRESGASGAYWAASATDHIVADPLSITGSIGVIGSYLDFSGLMADYNVTYERLIAGQYKDVGVPFRQLTSEERRLLQKKLDLMHSTFKDAVAKNRNLTRSEINALATGEFYLGMEAKPMGLVDELGGKEQAYAYIESKLGITVEPVVYERELTLLETISRLANSYSAKVQVPGMQASLT